VSPALYQLSYPARLRRLRSYSILVALEKTEPQAFVWESVSVYYFGEDLRSYTMLVEYIHVYVTLHDTKACVVRLRSSSELSRGDGVRLGRG
jgi:hypothetical protein